MNFIEKVGLYLQTPVPAAALAVFRILFGILLFCDCIIERGWAEEGTYSALKDISSNKMCSFPLFDFMPKVKPEAFALLMAIQAFAALCIMLGFLHRFSCFVYLSSFWYIVLSNKLRWNNHSYLYGLMVMLLMLSSANNKFSLDGWLFKYKTVDTVPYWNYFLIQVQIAIVYTYAGINKLNDDWLQGRSLPYLTNHWMFQDLKKLFPAEYFDLIAVRIAGILIDSLAGVALFFRATRPLAIIFTTAFHFMNSQIFSIGVFSGVMLATNALFLPNYTLPPPWPKPKKKTEEQSISSSGSKCKRYVIAAFTVSHVILQLLIPKSHALFPGMITWSKIGQYGFSWEMMLHEWNIAHITVNLKDKHSGEDLFLDANRLVDGGSQRWAFHPDMIYQFSACVKHILSDSEEKGVEETRFSLYIDSWISLNQRVHQRLIDPHNDFFNTSWSVFKKPKWVLPLIESLPPMNSASLLESLSLPSLASDVTKTEYLIFADFPNFSLHHFIDSSLDDVQLFVLNGSVSVEFDEPQDDSPSVVELKTGDNPLLVPNGQFHTLVTTSGIPSLCIYTFVNRTLWEATEMQNANTPKDQAIPTPPSIPTAAIRNLAGRVSSIFAKAKQGVAISERAFRSVAFGEAF